MEKEALIVVDVQNDFCPGGKLAVTEGDQVIAPLNKMIHWFHLRSDLVVFTRDWHPQGSEHFLPQGAWPEHCIQGTKGAHFHPQLKTEGGLIISKGTQIEENAYSGFDGQDDQGNPLLSILKAKGVKRILVGGLATDYCVKATAIDGAKRGFEVLLLEDAIRAVRLSPGDELIALGEMLNAGVKMINSEAYPSQRICQMIVEWENIAQERFINKYN